MKIPGVTSAAEITVRFEPGSTPDDKERFRVHLYKRVGDHKKTKPPAVHIRGFVNKDSFRTIISQNPDAMVIAEAGVMAELFDSTPVPESRFGHIDVGTSSYGHFLQQ